MVALVGCVSCGTTLIKDAVERSADGWRIVLVRLVDGPNQMSQGGVYGQPHVVYEPSAGYRFIHAYMRVRNDGPQRSFNYGWCGMDVDSGGSVRPILRTPWRGLIVPVDESEGYEAGAETWRTLTFEYPVGRLPHFLTCGRVTFDVPSSPRN